MANAEHLELLKQGIEVWNQWRENNSEVKPDLRGADLIAVNLSEVNLSGADLVRANLSSVNLHNADLRRASLIAATLSNADLSQANLYKVKLRRSHLDGANLCGANLDESDLSGADLSESDLQRASLINTRLRAVKLSGSDCRQAQFFGAYLCSSDMQNVDLREACLDAANLSCVILSEANLRNVDLRGANLRCAKLVGASLRGTNLVGANLHRAVLADTDLSRAYLDRADLSHAYLIGANLLGIDLRKVTLTAAILGGALGGRATLVRGVLIKSGIDGAGLRGANLAETNLSGFDLRGADLCGADLSSANLTGTDLSNVQAMGTSFEAAVFTGACLENWKINSTTKLEGAFCDYVYLKSYQRERRPRVGIFKPGEFAALFQPLLDNVDLIFTDGIDWQAFFQSFQDLCSQYAYQDISIQAIEKKRGSAFIIRLEVAEGSDKSAIESSAKELYETKLTLLEQCYRAELQAKDGEIVACREQSANLMKITEMLAARPPMSEGNKYDLRGAQFGGGYVAGNVEGNQYGGIINNYGSNAEDITRLLTALRDQAQTFPTDQKDDANDALDLLERDLADEQPDQGRIGRRLKKLLTLGAAIGTIASGAAAVSGDVSTFTGNVIELTEQLGIPIEQVQLPPSGTP